MKNIIFQLSCIGVLLCCSRGQAIGQLTARGADGDTITAYVNAYGKRDTIFVFNQMPQTQQGNLSLQQPGINTFKWYRFDNETRAFAETAFFTTIDAASTSQSDLAQGGYKVTVTPAGETAPRDSFVAWLYMNPGFELRLYKDDNGELMSGYKFCTYTDFRLQPETPIIKPSTFTYYNPNRLLQAPLVLNNRITYTMKRGADTKTVFLNTQGERQYLREDNPPHEDMQYHFRAYDLFGIEDEDDIMYRTILPYVTLDAPVLPDVDPQSAPVPVRFTCQPNRINLQNSEYIWRFGNGDTLLYDADHTPPDTIKYTYYTPKTQGYQVTLTVTSQWHCTYTTPPITIEVDDPQLEVPNVFTPNGDNVNDHFKPLTVSLRWFEITIYTRTGKRVFQYKGNDLRSWQGWDGRIENTGREAAEGVYFYVVKGTGWDEPPTVYDHKSRKNSSQPQTFGGSFHLYR